MKGEGNMRGWIMAAAMAAVTAVHAGEARPLFNGRNLDGWMKADGSAPGTNWIVQGGGVLTRAGKGGDIWTKETFGNFYLEVEFRTEGNSGIFIRTDDPKNNVQTGIEIQVNTPGGPDKHSVGAIYDLVAPSMNAGKTGWNRIVIVARNNMLTVELNNEKVATMDLDRWTEGGKNPDGSKNKFKKALKDFARKGHIGFQDHGANVAYRNIRITPFD